MKLTPPTTIVFWASVVVALVGLLAQFGMIASLAPFAFYIVLIGFLILAVSLMIKGA
jgi:hypothetical protein